MYTGQSEKYTCSVFTFGDRANITASATAIVKGFLTAPGGTNAATLEFAVLIPRNGVLKNLYWSAEKSTLVAAGNSATAYVKDPPTAPASVPTALKVSWNGNVIAGSNTTNSVPVAAGDTLCMNFQLAKGSGVLTRLRVSIELEVDAQYPNPWDLTGATVSYTGGSVGIGTLSPAGELHVSNSSAGGIAGIFETPSGKILSGRAGATEQFSVDAGGNLYASGKVGIGNTAPAAELDVNGMVQMQGMTLPTGANAGYVLTSDAGGAGSWQAPSGFGGTGTPNAIPKFLGASAVDDSVIFQNGGNIGIGTTTPSAALEVNGAISGFGIVPLGSIVAWHPAWIQLPKGKTGKPGLPDGWLECNGQVITDPDSPFVGSTLPNLNGDGRFLRGGAISGKLQADNFKSHSHTMGTGAGDSFTMVPSGDPINAQRLAHFKPDGWNVGSPKSTDASGVGTETCPINMSVVWIMRIK